jgi:superfamily II DNA helicase RecQ
MVERSVAGRIVQELQRWDGQSTGTLYKNLYPSQDVERRRFEELVGAMVRAGALRLSADQFEKDGKAIKFQRAHLLPGAVAAISGESFVMEDARARGAKGAKKKKKAEAAAAAAGADPALVEKLRAWRLQVSRGAALPAFRVMADRVMLAIAARRPQTAAQLLQVSGVGPKLVEKYGKALLVLLK